jgi:uncharacterized membrane protein YphA (DoxX/SURF4 family)
MTETNGNVYGKAIAMMEMTECTSGGRKTALLRLLDFGSRWLLATVFLFAGIPKVADPQTFATIIGAYGLLPEMMLLPMAVLLPLAEIAAAVALIWGRREGLWGAGLMLLLFIAVLGYGIQMGLDIDCGCFGPEDPEHKAFAGLRVALIRDILLFIPLLYGTWYKLKYSHE